MFVLPCAAAGHWGRYGVVGCLTAAAMGLLLVQARILSALYDGYAVYSTVTIALMGFSVAGVLVGLWSRRHDMQSVHVAIACAACAFTTLLCVALVSRLPVWLPQNPLVTAMLLPCLLLSVPFMCSGVALRLAFIREGAHHFYLCVVVLAASAVICMLFSCLLTLLGASGFVWLCVALACIACVLQTSMHKLDIGETRMFIIVMIVALFPLGGQIVGNRPVPYRMLGQTLMQHGTFVETTRWTPMGRLDVVSIPHDDYKMVTLDGDAYTNLYMSNRVRLEILGARHGELDWVAEAMPFKILGKRAQESLVIGMGGGLSLIHSHAYGARHTTGVEMNPVMGNLLRYRYADVAVWPHWPDMTLVADEGRHFVHMQDNRYDVITLSGIDTFFSHDPSVFLENYLYTTEAFEDYLKALTRDGIMAISGSLDAGTLGEGLTYMDAARRQGIAHPGQSVMVIATDDRVVMLIRKTPFTRQQVLWAMSVLRPMHQRVIYLPAIFPLVQQQQIEKELALQRDGKLNLAHDAYEQMINPASAQAREAFLAAYPGVTPVYDDRPFFFAYHQGVLSGEAGGMSVVHGNAEDSLCWLLLVCTLAALVAMIGPLLAYDRKGLQAEGAPLLILYFACLGLGSMLITVGMMQRLSLYLGDPMHALMAVLPGLLVFTGLGAMASTRLPWPRRQVLMLGTAGTCALILLWLLVMPPLLRITQSLPFMARAFFADVSLLPVGIAMTLPFSAGLRHIETYCPQFINWAKGVNGFFTVVAPLLAILLAMHSGFTMVLVVAALAYLLGYAAIVLYQHRIRENPL